MIKWEYMSFNRALLISFISHSLVIFPLGIAGVFFPETKMREKDVTYYSVRPIRVPQSEDVSVKVARIRKIVRSVKPPSSVISRFPVVKEEKIASARSDASADNGKKDASQAARAAAISEPAARTQQDDKGRAFQGASMPADSSGEKTKSATASLSGATLEPTPGTILPNTPECISYYHYLREAIRDRLEKEYRSGYGEGAVCVSFTLNQTGELANINIVEGRVPVDPSLKGVAYNSVKKISPFKSFPKNLTLKQISFTLTIVFKKR